MKTSTIITIGAIAGFWIIAGIVNSFGCFLLFAGYISAPPIEPSLWFNVARTLAGLTTILAGISVIAGIQLIRRKSWARILLLFYSWLIALAIVGLGIYWAIDNYHQGTPYITYTISRFLGLIVLPAIMIYFLQSKELINAMNAEHAPPAGRGEAPRP